MSRGGDITLAWGDQDHTFRLGMVEWRRVQEKCDAGPGEIYRRLILVATALANGMSLKAAAASGMIGDWRVDDMREVILAGLIGGGMTEVQAAPLVRTRVDEPLDFKTNLALAYAIVKAGLGDVEDEPLGEKVGETAPPVSPVESSASPGSTTTASRWDAEDRARWTD